MIRFGHPEYLHILWVTAALVVFALWEHRWRLRAMRRWANERLWDTALPNRAPGRVLARRLLTAAAFALVAAGAADPQVGTRLVEAKREGSDIVVAVDVSNSMLAEDITPNRMLRARHEIARLLDRSQGDRVALVPFAGVAFVQVPLTLDYAAVMAVLNSFEPGMIPQPGTSLAAAIKQARRAFRPEGKAQKVLLLISDGEDHEPGAVDQAKQAAKEDIIIYTVGMASPTGAPIPVRDDRGNVAGYKKDSNGGTVISRLNEKLLQDIATASGGRYYRATAAGGEFKEIYKHIAGLDKETFEERQYTDFEHRFQWLLGAALSLLVIGQIIPGGKQRRAV